MKNLYAALVLVFCSFVSNAQIVNIPDPVFKNLLVNTNCTDNDGGIWTINDDVDINNDGEIQLNEALAVKVLEFDNASNYDLSGIEAFSNLEVIYFVNFSFENLDLSGVPSLKGLLMHSGTIGALNVSGLVNLELLNSAFCNFPTTDWSSLTSLEKFEIWEGSIPSLDLSNLPNLKEIFMAGGPTAAMATINLTGVESLEKLSCGVFGLTSIDLSSNINLTELYCGRNQLTTLDLSHNPNLTIFDCSSNQLTTLDLSHNNNLLSLGFSNNLFTSINISNLTQLTSIYCGDNQLTTLDITVCPQLMDLYCYNNQLTTLDLSNASHLAVLSCGGNQLTSLNTTNLLALRRVGVSNNLFTTLDLSYSLAQSWYDLNFSNNPNLTYLNLKNGAGFWFHQSDSFNVTNCPNLQYICADERNFQEILANTQAQVTSYCSFTPSGIFNTISGTLSYDMNNNGCDVSDTFSFNNRMKINDASNIFGATYTNTSGNYNFFTQAGNFNITPEFENPYFTVSPSSATITFADSNNNTQTQNFCVTPNGVHNDVEVSVLPVQRPRPGFDATYQMVYKNKGNQVLSGNVNFAFNDAVLDFVSANPTLSAQSLNTLSWSYSNLLPFESRTINFTLNVNSPQEIPAVNNGDVLSFSASIDPISGDETVNDNTFVLAQTVLGSYDPNDKTCLEGNTIVPERIGEYLHYLIRFQNSGTAAAENIVVKDIIDTTKFDITSLQLTSASHNYTTKITGNKVEFIFENINLPAEIDNEVASHGFVAFKIKTKNNLTLGNSVSNKADIYFDYNFPITTNEATTTFATLGVNQIENKSVAVFPNPVNDILTITSKGNLTSIQLLDVQGRILTTYLENEEKATINLSDKASGVYFVKIFTEKGVKLEKIVKK